MGRVHVAHLEAGALARQAAWPKRGYAALVGDLGQRIGLVHKLRQLRRAKELTHRSSSRLGVDQIRRHDGVDLDRTHTLADGTLHAQQANAILVFHQLANRADTAVAEVVDIVNLAAAVLQASQHAQDCEDVFLTQNAQAVLSLELKARVHFHPADRRQVVTVGVEEQALEQRMRAFKCRRLAGAHHAIDVDERFFTAVVPVCGERVAQMRAVIDIVDEQHADFGSTLVNETLQQLLGNLVTGLGEDLTSLHVNAVISQIAADQVLIRGEHTLDTGISQLAKRTRGHLRTGRGDNLARLGIDQVANELATLQGVGVKAIGPAVTLAGVADGPIEFLENLVTRHTNDARRIQILAAFGTAGCVGDRIIIRQRHQEGGDRQLALAVDPHIEDVLGVKLEVEPGTAVRNDARGEQQLAGRMGLAAVMIEEHTGRTVHLRDDHALGTVHDEGTVRCHQGHVAHIDVLFLDVADRTGTGDLVLFPHLKAQCHFQRRRIGQAALLALFDIIFRRLEIVGDKFQLRPAGEILDREDRVEGLLKAVFFAIGSGDAHLQKCVVARALHIDQVRHGRDFRQLAKTAANTPATVESAYMRCHMSYLVKFPFDNRPLHNGPPGIRPPCQQAEKAAPVKRPCTGRKIHPVQDMFCRQS